MFICIQSATITLHTPAYWHLSVTWKSWTYTENMCNFGPNCFKCIWGFLQTFIRNVVYFFKCKRLFFSLKKRHLQLLPSLCVLFIIPPAWAVVGHGSNVNRRSSYNASPKKVIVSRSHSGKVKNYIRNAFGNSTTIIEAGGAGEWSFTFI